MTFSLNITVTVDLEWVRNRRYAMISLPSSGDEDTYLVSEESGLVIIEKVKPLQEVIDYVWYMEYHF